MSKIKLPNTEDSFIHHQQTPVRAFVFAPVFKDAAGIAEADPASRLQEAVGLAEAISLNIVGAQYFPLKKPNAATLFGEGRVREIAELIAKEQGELVIIDHALTPVQQRNLEKSWNCKVIDRTALILEIFGERARTKEGVLQVELAHLNYQKGRLVRSWTHLERQRGGGGFLGGPGETQIETDRRLLQEKITRIKRELAKTVKTRKLHRIQRQKAPYPVIALVGYTNAGKSTLFNRLTGAEVLAENMLFATLDPTLRRIHLGKNSEGNYICDVSLSSCREEQGSDAGNISADFRGDTLILSDTVGFIAHLPTHLIAAFRATLEEVTEADMIIHVRDMANPDNAAHKRNVIEILNTLNVDTENSDKIIEVWNKTDLLAAEQRHILENQAKTALLPTLLISAATGEGTDALTALIAEKTLGAMEEKSICLSQKEFYLLDWLHRHGKQKNQTYADNGNIILEIALSETNWQIFSALRRKHNKNNTE